jgi:hypothetical protein
MSRLSSPRRTSPRASAVLVLGGLAVAGCASGTGQLTTSSTPNADGSISANKVANTDIDCPAMMVRSGASTWQVPAGASSTNLRYQGSLGQLARECAVLGDTMTIKVGVEGRVLVGPKGGAGSLAVPLRLALVQEGPQPKSIWTKFYSVPVNVPQGQTQVTFTQVEDDLTFAIPASKDVSSYVIYVGYDPQGAAASAKVAKKKPSSGETKTAAKPKTTKSKTPPTASAPVQQQMTPVSAQPTFAPAAPSSGGFAPPPPGPFAPPPQAPKGTNG